MTIESAPSPPVRRLSMVSLASLICGLLFCVPFLTGGLAILLGIVGFLRTSGAELKGRWMAIVGALLGAASIAAWVIFLVAGGAYWVWSSAEAPKVATHDVLQAASDGDVAKIKTLTENFDDAGIELLEHRVQSHGKFTDATFSSVKITNDTAEVEGVAQFESGPYEMYADLHHSAGWKVTQIRISPPK